MLFQGSRYLQPGSSQRDWKTKRCGAPAAGKKILRLYLQRNYMLGTEWWVILSSAGENCCSQGEKAEKLTSVLGFLSWIPKWHNHFALHNPTVVWLGKSALLPMWQFFSGRGAAASGITVVHIPHPGRHTGGEGFRAKGRGIKHTQKGWHSLTCLPRQIVMSVHTCMLRKPHSSKF